MTAIIQPCGKSHAISNVVFVFEFAEVVAPHDFVELRPNGTYHEKLIDKLPRFAEQQQIMFNFGPDQNVFAPPVSQPSIVAGVTFETLLPNGTPKFAINIQTNNLIFSCGQYTRWKDIWQEAIDHITLLSEWLKEIKISAVTLQYTDSFKVKFKNGERLPLTDLFCEESSYLPSNFKNINHAFHSHHGFFEDPAYELPGRLLNNINVNVTETSGTFDANIICSHKFNFVQLENLIEEDKLAAYISPCFNYLHDVNKTVVGNLLTDNVKTMINFNAGRSE